MVQQHTVSSFADFLSGNLATADVQMAINIAGATIGFMSLDGVSFVMDMTTMVNTVQLGIQLSSSTSITALENEMVGRIN